MGWQSDSPVPPGDLRRTDCRSLPSAGPPGGHWCPAGPGLRAQVRGTTAPCGHRHGHNAGHRPFHCPSPGRGPRKTAFAGLSRQRPGSSRSARPCPSPGCIMGNVVRSARSPAVPRGGGGGAQGPGSAQARPDPGGTRLTRHRLFQRPRRAQAPPPTPIPRMNGRPRLPGPSTLAN